MQTNRYIGFSILVLIFCQTSISSKAQLGLTFNIPKPKQYEERVLPYEKSETKKFTKSRRFFQNLTTHYNYFFNANNKLNDIIARAKEAHKDDYTQLLPFYNYELEVTQKDSVQLDSVIYKATSGIVLHDLRSDWADNMYLLWGAAYYLKKQFDSAYLTFQFINYAFAPKEKDGYYLYIGSSRDGNNAMSISTKEKSNVVQKIFNQPPSRNDAFIWQIRTFLAQDAFPEANSLIVTLKNDPAFPKRLQTDLEEVQAYYFYKQNMWDSAALHLSRALDNATSKNEKGRWEFLTAQLYERAGKNDLAQRFYERSIGNTVDPVMEVYARLYSVKVNKSGSENFLEKNIAELTKMAKRDKYEDYRDIIYYMAAQMELERNNIGGAQKLLLKASEYGSGNAEQRNRIYLELGDLAFQNKDYRQAYSFYDSLQLNDPSLKDTALIRQRKNMLGRIALQTEILARQDSMLKIANMPEEQRKEFVKKLVKELRKQQGLKDDDVKLTGGNLFDQPNDIFTTSQSSKGEWYFYNSALRAKGASDFKARWGNRPNVDNWRRLYSVTNQINKTQRPTDNVFSPKTSRGNDSDALTFDGLYNRLPLTQEQIKTVNDSVQNALFELGKIYAEEMEDCGAIINTYEDLRIRYPSFPKMDEVLFHLYYCYHKNGNMAKETEMKNLLKEKYAMSRYTGIIFTGKDLQGKGPNREATKTYENIYDLFIEGKFDEAIIQKRAADSIYGENYWTPQLLYIEAVYDVKQRNDSLAILNLHKIENKYPNTPLAKKATALIDVLGRRNQIEEELRNLKIDTQQVIRRSVLVRNDSNLLVKKDTAKAVVKTNQPPKVDNKNVKADTVVKKQVIPTVYIFNPNTSHYAMIILNKVDIVFGNEAKNAFARYNRERFSSKNYDVSVIDLNPDTKLVLIKPFANVQDAADYALQAKKMAAGDIIPWLKPDKYSFSVISDQNLEILKSNPDLAAYKRFLDQNLPGKF